MEDKIRGKAEQLKGKAREKLGDVKKGLGGEVEPEETPEEVTDEEMTPPR